jgi:hypothetical protein
MPRWIDRDVFEKPALFSAAHRINRRVVQWAGTPDQWNWNTLRQSPRNSNSFGSWSKD